MTLSNCCVKFLFVLLLSCVSFSGNFVTASCSFTINDNVYDLSPLTLTDGSSYKTTFSFLKLDFLFNVCGSVPKCYNKFTSKTESQACTTFPVPIQVGSPSSQTASENSNGITLSYTSESDFVCKRSNNLVFTCDNSTDFQVTSMSVDQCEYTVRVNSRFACPKPKPNPNACVFKGNNVTLDLSPLILPNNTSYNATFYPVNDYQYKVYFAVCGQVDLCRQYKQQKEMGIYQSCQLLTNQYPTLSVQTGIPTALNATISQNRAILNYTSNAYPCHDGFYRYNILDIQCDKSTNFAVVSTLESPRCVYRIDIKSKYACSN
ncbi:hypothetical protein CYY_007854 [Polysphondylium violaceum]|uniref:MRH domain-containing protein n=1 Tax=Polysphondylium violaceum TaxID=133409 RepID=A0A8J4UXE8_9MYCE|nr:hypothetical protein CYY_007854 [Polysphondylium violaceum]